MSTTATTAPDCCALAKRSRCRSLEGLRFGVRVMTRLWQGCCSGPGNAPTADGIEWRD